MGCNGRRPNGVVLADALAHDPTPAALSLSEKLLCFHGLSRLTCAALCGSDSRLKLANTQAQPVHGTAGVRYTLQAARGQSHGSTMHRGPPHAHLCM